MPKGGRWLFLPQQPYFPIGSLRNALLFAVGQDRGLVGDSDIAAALESVGLGALAGRLDEQQHWEQILSPGEQQRLAIAQALLSKPDWLFLDEATSALDEEQEANVYRALTDRLPRTTLVSIGHRRSVAPFHARVIRLETS
jgi:putative ATP-binding cassette transporter